MAHSSAAFIGEILVEHFEELEFLWGQRQNAYSSTTFTLRDLHQFEERISAHIEGLLTGAENTVEVVKGGLLANDVFTVIASASALLWLQKERATHLVLEALTVGQETRLEGIRQALCHGPITLLVDELREIFKSGAPLLAAAAAEALAFHGQLVRRPERLNELLRDGEASVRRIAWRVVALAGPPVSAEEFRKAFDDDDEAVRREALWAATWTAQSFLLNHLRSLASGEISALWEGIFLFAILGSPEDLHRIMALGSRDELGPQRFALLAAYGHPSVIDILLRNMRTDDVATKVAAAAAFTQITGKDIGTDKRVALPLGDGHEPDEFEKEFLDEVHLPDIEKGLRYWEESKSNFSSGTRWAGGFDLSHGVSADVLEKLDLRSRHNACLRGRFNGKWGGGLIDLERFPSKPLLPIAG